MKMNKTTGYKYYEDNGGGLHLFVFENGKVVDGITNLEYAGKGEWDTVKDDLNENAVSAVRSWEGHMKDIGINAAELYDEVQASQYGYKLVCDNGKLYVDCMGAAAQIYFGVERD
jgi:hypothetical protein